MSSGVVKGLLVPAAPHVRLGNSSKWDELKKAYEQAGEAIKEANVDAIVYYSTNSVVILGQFIQGLPNPKGIRVDENWYNLGEIPYDFSVDTELAAEINERINNEGLQSRVINYDNYPIDTGTVVAQSFLNPESTIPSTIISCNLYTGKEDLQKMGQAVHEAAKAQGKRIAVVAVAGLSQGFYNYDIDPEEDSVNEAHDELNKRFLDLVEAGDTKTLDEFEDEYVKETSTNLQLKAFNWLQGAVSSLNTNGKVLAYGPIWGSGAAVIEW